MDDELIAYAAHGAPPLPKPTASGHVERDGARIWYAAYGAGAPVVLLHGAFGNGDNFGFQVPALIAAGYAVILIDSRGHGRSTRDARPLIYRHMAGDVPAVLDALGIASAAIAGWSDGAIIALDLAIIAPQRVRGVFWFGGSTELAGIQTEIVPTPLFGRMFARHRSDYARLSPTPHAWETFSAAVNAAMEAQPATPSDELAALTVPVAVVFAERDEFGLLAHNEWVARTIPDAKLVILPRVSHFAPLQRPELFNDALLAFLATLPHAGWSPPP